MVEQQRDPVYPDKPEGPDDPQGPESTYKPPAMTLTTLGWLKYMEAHSWQYFEHQYLRLLHNTLREDWQCIHGGVGPGTLQKWMNMCKVLELDNKARVDPTRRQEWTCFLLAQSGLVGRNNANNILWNL